MKTLKITLALFFIILLSGFNAMAQMTSVPNIISAPVVLYDEGGNVLADGNYTVIVGLKDSSGNTLYSEEHNVTVTNGVAPIIIGNGYAVGSNQASPAGGVTWDLLNVNGDVTVEILVNGQSTVQRIATLASQPYSLISNYALDIAGDTVSSSKIVDGSITEDDLSQDLQDQLANIATSDNNTSSTMDAEDIQVTSALGLNNSGGSTVGEVLMDLDSVIDNIRNLELVQLSESISNINSTLSGLDATYLKKSGGTMTGDLDMGGNDIVNVGTVDGVDVSALSNQVSELVTELDNEPTDPIYNTITVTGANTTTSTNDSGIITTTTATAPSEGTLYQNNMIFAWAVIQANGTSTNPGLFNSFNIASVEKAPSELSSSGSENQCNYKLNFQRSASDGTSYMVNITTGVSTGDSVGIVRVTAASYVIVGVASSDAGDDCNAAEQSQNLHVMIVGGTQTN